MFRNFSIVKNITIRSALPVKVIRDNNAVTPVITGISRTTGYKYEIQDKALIKRFGLHRMVIGKSMHMVLPRPTFKTGSTISVAMDWQDRNYVFEMLNDRGTILFFFGNCMFKSLRALSEFVIGQAPSSVDSCMEEFFDTKNRRLTHYLIRSALKIHKRKVG